MTLYTLTAMRAEAMESAISVPGKPSCTISNAVNLAPCVMIQCGQSKSVRDVRKNKWEWG